MRKGENTRGATLVEASLMLPIVILLTVSLLELGLAFKDLLTIGFTARDAARIGALAGNDIDADCNLIQTIVDGFSASDINDVTIEIFKASEATGEPTGGRINTWHLTSGDPTDCADWTVTENWPSTSRQVLVGEDPVTHADLELDILGVRITTVHHWITGLPPWRGTMTIERTALQRLEPEAFV